jgi:Protein of unknown function (DUF3073)
MGRGRAKAKQTKVARELKYSSGGTDLDALRKELTSRTPRVAAESGSINGLEDDAATAETDQDDEDAESELDDEADDLDGRYGASGRR